MYGAYKSKYDLDHFCGVLHCRSIYAALQFNCCCTLNDDRLIQHKPIELFITARLQTFCTRRSHMIFDFQFQIRARQKKQINTTYAPFYSSGKHTQKQLAQQIGWMFACLAAIRICSLSTYFHFKDEVKMKIYTPNELAAKA